MHKLNLRVLLHQLAAQAREHQLLQLAELRVVARQVRAQQVQVRPEPAQRQVLPVLRELLKERNQQWVQPLQVRV
jgi:hypothetical protein